MSIVLLLLGLPVVEPVEAGFELLVPPNVPVFAGLASENHRADVAATLYDYWSYHSSRHDEFPLARSFWHGISA